MALETVYMRQLLTGHGYSGTFFLKELKNNIKNNGKIKNGIIKNEIENIIKKESKLENAMQNSQSSFILTSRVFENYGQIPPQYTCDGMNTVVPLSIMGTPSKTASLVLIMDDPDIPDSVKKSRGVEVFDHWVVFNMPPSTKEIIEGQEPDGTLGNNSAGRKGYTGPCPPDSEHRYFFKLYALDAMLDLPEGSSKKDVEKAMEGHIIAQTELVGLYERIDNR